MTLLVSELREYGVVMVADSAVTTVPCKSLLPPGDGIIAEYVSTGAQKLWPIPAIGAGVSVWGRGRIGQFPADYWLYYFADQVTAGTSLVDVGKQIASAVNELEAKPKTSADAFGFHLGGYIETTEGCLPALYHVHCGHADEEPHELRLYRDCPEDRFADTDPRYGFSDYAEYRDWLSEARGYQLRNGMFDEFAAVSERLNVALFTLRARGFESPSPDDLANRETHLRDLFELFCGIYARSNRPKRIARPISSLSIGESGVMSFKASSPAVDAQGRLT
jgi:hypothetical protein